MARTDVHLALDLPNVEDFADPLVADPGLSAGLGQQLRCVPGVVSPHELQRDLPVELQVIDQENRSHPSLPQQSHRDVSVPVG